MMQIVTHGAFKKGIYLTLARRKSRTTRIYS